jgi:asparagine synthase (glutamine-hydrolysing)
MPSIVGILHPFAFQPSQIMNKISKTYETLPGSTPFRFFRSKNLEVGTWNLHIECNLSKTKWVFFSGFLYNKDTLITDLKERGFPADHDFNFLVYAYEAWGEAFIEKLDGPFFIIIYDEKEKRVTLALDRMGQKSLYWVDQGNYFLFGSDLKGILATGLVSQNPSSSSFASYLYFGYIPQDFSAIQSINKLLPGNTLTLNLKKQYQIKNYWSLGQSFMQNKRESTQGAMDRFGLLMKQKMRLFSESETPLSIEWNSTTGSSLLNYEIFHMRPKEKLTTLAQNFSEQTENPFSWKVEGYQTSLDTLLDELPKLVWTLDEPIADLKTVSRWNLAKKAQSRGEHLVTSLGFDEIFALHKRYHTSWIESSGLNSSIIQDLAHFPPTIRDQWIRPLLQWIHPPSAYRLLRNIDIDSRQVRYLNYIALFKGASRKFVSPRLYPFFDPEVFAQRFHRLSRLSHTLNPALYFDLKTGLPDSTLFQYERLFPGVGVHTPFLTKDFLIFASSLPGIYGESIKKGDKLFIDRYLDEHQITLPILPSCPLESQWSSSKRLREIFKTLKRGRIFEDEWVDPHWIERQLKPREMTPLAFRQMWSLLMLELWIRLFIVRPVDTANPSQTTEQLLN